MAGSFYDNRDSADINELAALNNDISDDLINQLQQQLTEKFPAAPTNVPINENDDTTLFEESTTTTEETNTDIKNNESSENTENNENTENINEIGNPPEEIDENTENADSNDSEDKTSQENSKKEKVEVNQSFDDNFIKKYKAKLQKKAKGKDSDEQPVSYGGVAPASGDGDNTSDSKAADNTPIESLSQGNITERPLTEDLKGYNDSLDFLDGNVKYSKYVIYIDPENVDFIDGLTVKERKNLINGILRQQNDISITKQRFKVIQTIIRHVIILVLTLSISIPVIYHAINASLEATINNHRSAQTNWQTLYREHGKITRN